MNHFSEIINESYELPNRVFQTSPNPKVTIRTATYNHAPLIRKCIEGVLMQETNFQIEYLIGEDFSTDGTREIVFEYAQKYPQIIRVITSDKNVGLNANNYRCRKATRGEFTAICEGDDYWTDPKKLQKQIDLLTEHPECDLCFHPAKIIYLDSKETVSVTGKHADENCIIPVKTLIFNHGDFCPTASLVVRTKINTHLGDWYMKSPIGDYYYQVLGAERGGALYLNEVMSVYNKGSKGLWSQTVQELRSDFTKKYTATLIRCNSLRNLDKELDYRQHKWLNKLEKKILLKKFIPFFSFTKNKRNEIKETIRKNSEGSLKISCYTILVLSFIYHKLKIKKILPIFWKI